jgi:hypothetical protein
MNKSRNSNWDTTGEGVRSWLETVGKASADTCEAAGILLHLAELAANKRRGLVIALSLSVGPSLKKKRPSGL